MRRHVLVMMTLAIAPLTMLVGGTTTVRANPTVTVAPTVSVIPTSLEQGCMAAAPDKELTLGAIPPVVGNNDPKNSLSSPLPNPNDGTSTHYGFRQFYGKAGCPNEFIMDLKITPQTTLPTQWGPNTPIAESQRRFNPQFVIGGIQGTANQSRGYREIDATTDLAGLSARGYGSKEEMCRKMFVRVVFGWKKNGWTSFKAQSTAIYAYDWNPAGDGTCEPMTGILNQSSGTSYTSAMAAADGWGKIPASGFDTYRIAVGAGLLSRPATMAIHALPGVSPTLDFINAGLDPLAPANIGKVLPIYQQLPVGVSVQGT